jgi:hypothetical protein
MSSKTVSVPRYRHHKGSGQAFVQVNGRRHYLGKWDTPQSKERCAAYVAELAVCPTPLPLATPASAITVIELAAYLDFAEGYYQKLGKPTTHLPQLKAAIRAIRDLYGYTGAAKFGPLALRAIQQKMVGTGASRRYINQHVGHIKRMFKWGVSVELLTPSVYQAIATVPGLKAGRTAARETPPILPVAGEVCQLRPVDVERRGLAVSAGVPQDPAPRARADHLRRPAGPRRAPAASASGRPGPLLLPRRI